MHVVPRRVVASTRGVVCTCGRAPAHQGAGARGRGNCFVLFLHVVRVHAILQDESVGRQLELLGGAVASNMKEERRELRDAGILVQPGVAVAQEVLEDIGLGCLLEAEGVEAEVRLQNCLGLLRGRRQRRVVPLAARPAVAEAGVECLEVLRRGGDERRPGVGDGAARSLLPIFHVVRAADAQGHLLVTHRNTAEVQTPMLGAHVDVLLRCRGRPQPQDAAGAVVEAEREAVNPCLLQEAIGCGAEGHAVLHALQPLLADAAGGSRSAGVGGEAIIGVGSLAEHDLAAVVVGELRALGRGVGPGRAQAQDAFKRARKTQDLRGHEHEAALHLRRELADADRVLRQHPFDDPAAEGDHEPLRPLLPPRQVEGCGLVHPGEAAVAGLAVAALAAQARGHDERVAARVRDDAERLLGRADRDVDREVGAMVHKLGA
mmetsp:Transcript_19347/g.56160  ORF Transcript_19347/g.56160 Transcript_19347/m.56160 type:complete len:433 (+) Transcript_19347:329-1627(+)